MRPAAASLALALLLPSCALFNRGRNDLTETTLPTTAATSMDVVRTQLQHHGFTLREGAEFVVMTAPKAIQPYHRDKADTSDASMKGDRWFLRVEVEPATFTAGSRVRVQGFVIPRNVPSATGGAAQTQAILVPASDEALYADVRAAARWISDEANRRGPRQSGGERPN